MDPDFVWTTVEPKYVTKQINNIWRKCYKDIDNAYNKNYQSFKFQTVLYDETVNFPKYSSDHSWDYPYENEKHVLSDFAYNPTD